MGLHNGQDSAASDVYMVAPSCPIQDEPRPENDALEVRESDSRRISFQPFKVIGPSGHA
jgi:hypothetical protein